MTTVANHRLIRQAHDQGMWLCWRSQDMWFSPDELAAQYAQGYFQLEPVTWELRDPAERVKELEAAVEGAMMILSQFRQRVKESK